MRNEDNAILPLSSGQISLLCELCQSNKALSQAAEKTLKQHPWLSSPLQASPERSRRVRPSLMFNCRIQVQITLSGVKENNQKGQTRLKVFGAENLDP